MYCGGWIFTKLCCFLQNTTSMTSEAICIHFSRVGRLSSESELTPTYPQLFMQSADLHSRMLKSVTSSDGI